MKNLGNKFEFIEERIKKENPKSINPVFILTMNQKIQNVKMEKKSHELKMRNQLITFDKKMEFLNNNIDEFAENLKLQKSNRIFISDQLKLLYKKMLKHEELNKDQLFEILKSAKKIELQINFEDYPDFLDESSKIFVDNVINLELQVEKLKETSNEYNPFQKNSNSLGDLQLSSSEVKLKRKNIFYYNKIYRFLRKLTSLKKRILMHLI